MKRKEFLQSCGLGCLGLLGAVVPFVSCAGVKYLNGTLNGSYLEVPVGSFEIPKKGTVKFRNYIIVQHPALQYPICVYRVSTTEFTALLMKCTHQGTELQVFGDRLQCPAHGSEFSKTGVVKNGPAESDLRVLPVQIENNNLQINLS